jgi:hypothetical protein
MLIAGIRIGHIVAGLGIGENSTKYPSIPAGREGFIGTAAEAAAPRQTGGKFESRKRSKRSGSGLFIAYEQIPYKT